ncbi:MAG: MBL fold metallo-hydrolase, partial [Chloroflexi bacterium]|nr:MBL fold metallo-hydrolase [Chloroflexota bacterium]
THQGAIIDPGDDSVDILLAARELGLDVGWILLTHFHFDHVLAAHAVQRTTGARVAIHADDAPLLHRPPSVLRAFGPVASPSLRVDRTLADGDILSVGDLTIEVLHTPGHTPGSTSFYLASEKAVFSGDALFCEGIGRTDLPGGSYQTLLESIARRLLTLPDETAVYPGHGPATTIGHERLRNPWLRNIAR